MPSIKAVLRLRPSRRVTVALAMTGVASIAALPISLMASSQPDNRLQPVRAAYAAQAAPSALPAAGFVNADGSTLTAKLAHDADLRETLLALSGQSSQSKTSANQGGTTQAQPIVVDGSVTDIPAVALAAYRNAAREQSVADPSCHVPWSLLAGIGRVESSHGQYGGSRPDASGEVRPAILGPVLDGSGGNSAIPDTDGGRYDFNTQWDRAVGPMQFIPSSWATGGRDGNGDGVRDPENLFDAALAAANYLCRSGGDLRVTSAAEQAVLTYNHSWDYVLVVLGYAASYADQNLSAITADAAKHAAAVLRKPVGKGLKTVKATAAPAKIAPVAPVSPARSSHPAAPVKTVAPAAPISASPTRVTASPSPSPTPAFTPTPTMSASTATVVPDSPADASGWARP